MLSVFLEADNIIALAALITSIVSLWSSNRASKLSEGEIECQLSTLIRDGINRHIESSIELERYKEACFVKGMSKSEVEDTKLFKVLNSNVEANEEGLLNAYEEACAKYLDNKVHRARFQKSYHRQIANLVEQGLFDDKLNKPSSHYKCILIVYNHWYNFEDNKSLKKRKFFLF